MQAYVGYAPDLPPETPGIIADCEAIIPLPNGFKAQGAPLSVGVDALPSAARGFAVIRRLDNNRRIFAATSDAIYETTGTTWNDISRVGGYALGGDVEVRARFAQFGNVTVAAVGTNNYLQSSTTADFSDIAGAPKAKVVETVNNFVFAFNYLDDTHGLGSAPNGWWCSALGDETDWTPSVATQSVAGTFIETPGPVVAAKRLGSSIVAYKEKSAFLATYVGAPQIWNWQQLPGELGTFSQETLVSIGTAHFFISDDDFYMFDGSRFNRIGAPVRQTFFADLDPSYRTLITSAHDPDNGLIYWYYPSTAGLGTIDSCIVYNYITNKWGRSDTVVELCAAYSDPGITYDGIGAEYTNWDDLPTSISFDSSFWTSDLPVVAFFDAAHTIMTYGGTPTTSSITTGHSGSQDGFSTIKKIRPRFLVTPASSSVEYSHSNTNADAMTQNITSALTNNVYDLLWSARWHKFKFNFSGEMTTVGYSAEIAPDGAE